MSTIVNRQNAEHYRWGDGADGWHLLNGDSLSVIEERIPPGVKEQCHFHARAQQFFYVLDGIALIEVSGTEHRLEAGNGIHIPAGQPHQVENRGRQDLRLLVISHPHSHGDKTVMEKAC